MIDPPFDRVRSLAREYTVIPLCQTVLADTETPVSLYRRLGEPSQSFLLESADGGERQGRYSFIGTDPFLIFQARDNQIRVTERGRQPQSLTGNPFDVLEELLKRYRSPRYPGYPPFLGGAVGMIGYESVTHLEPVPRVAQADSDDIHLMFCDKLIIFDHLKRTMTLVINLHVPDAPGCLDQAYRDACARLSQWEKELTTPFSEAQPSIFGAWEEMAVDFDRAESNTSRERFYRSVEAAKEAIRRGDIFQLVLSQRWCWVDAPPPFAVYRVLRTLNPSPYMYYLSLGDESIVGTSPEMLIKVTDGTVETRPIAGTRPRGRTSAEDETLALDLLADEKERAEHVMLVDLGRNDIGRVSRYGTVRVTEQMEVENYSHVMHLVSHVKGELADGRTPLDAFRACFPAGTLSGAPKVKAMEIIAALEPEERGSYGGAIGYFSFDGNLDSCITIRTIHFRGSHAYVQAGAGIVADSRPENEYEETRNKARGMLRALAMAERLFSAPAIGAKER
ncbi:anthranilate synthase component I [Desmospora profundinema]|uniref:Anthranilate synthase component 1 n=1 Tax=Desmospora profundinema TaxID=1571184 RepID=A0ABU1IIA2_9BACL|nr:anthranilate synthase component I [Desmospora profundinema]MDR6224498.1 anthranilate synthase component 1 [Desmospora profundinema]